MNPLRRFSVVRAALIALAICGLPAASPHAAGARAIPLTATTPTRFSGQVVSIQGSSANPTSFILQMAHGSVLIVVGPNTVFSANSAEAEVEGFQSHDYAIVMARRVRHSWEATRIDFDVRPLDGTLQFSGVVLKVTQNGRRFVLRSSNTSLLTWITITARTTWRINGQLQAGLPFLTKGDVVQVTARRVAKVVVAVDIDLRTGVTGQF